MIKLKIFENYQELSLEAAKIIAEVIKDIERPVLCLSTGTSPLGIYQNLIKMNQKGQVDFQKVITFNLDEYVGLGAEDDQSYRYFMNENLFSKINIKQENTHVPLGTGDLEENARNYEKLINAHHGFDLALLGIGRNGHIAFNEPHSDPSTLTRVVKITESTIEANARLFNDSSEVPREAITMGITSIKKARKILIIATGKAKAWAVQKTLEGKNNPLIPASYLHDKDVILLVDQEAAKLV